MGAHKAAFLIAISLQYPLNNWSDGADRHNITLCLSIHISFTARQSFLWQGLVPVDLRIAAYG